MSLSVVPHLKHLNVNTEPKTPYRLNTAKSLPAKKNRKCWSDSANQVASLQNIDGWRFMSGPLQIKFSSSLSAKLDRQLSWKKLFPPSTRHKLEEWCLEDEASHYPWQSCSFDFYLIYHPKHLFPSISVHHSSSVCTPQNTTHSSHSNSTKYTCDLLHQEG